MTQSVKKKAKLIKAGKAKAVSVIPTAQQRVLGNVQVVSLILEYLKEVDVSYQPFSPTDIGWAEEFPRCKIDTFARLATVNRAFFHSSTDIVWARMDSLIPFMGWLLPADRDEHGRPHLPLTYQNNDVTIQDWERFSLYASKTHFLATGASNCLPISDGWLSYLTNSTARPKILFPNLRRLIATFSDALATFAAFNVAPVLNMLELHPFLSYPAAVENARALAIRFSRGPCSALTCLRLVNPASPEIIESISRIQSLTRLHLAIGHDSSMLKLSLLGRLALLQELGIVQIVNPRAVALAARFPPTVDIQSVLSEPPKIVHVKELRVKANGTTQYLVASELRPRNLAKLHLELIPDCLNAQMLLVPAVLALYAHRNHSLVSLNASLPSAIAACMTDLSTLDRHREDQRFQVDPFLAALSKLRQLSYLAIWFIPFLSLDIAPQLARVAQGLPNLTTLVILPQSISPLPTDELVLPPLRYLEDIAKHNPRLSVLRMLADLAGIPVARSQADTSSHGLKVLLLATAERRFEALSTKQKFDLVEHIDTLFPQARLDLPSFFSPLQMWFWTFIQESLSFYRKGRARTLNEADGHSML